jgi:Metallo-peptidase family M12B Reprolysin-like
LIRPLQNRFFVTLMVSLTFTAAASASVSSDSLWQDVSETTAAASATGARPLIPRTYRVLSLNVQAFQDLARTAPLELTHGVEDVSPIMTLPMPDGSFGRFRIQESMIVDAQLAAKLPDVKTYRGQGIDDPSASARLDFTPHGFHGFIRSARGAVYIDPFANGNVDYYISYWRRDYARREGVAPFRCGVGDATAPLKKTKQAISSENRPEVLAASGATLRTYRLALAATGEYTAFYGGTVPLAQAGMVTTMNRVNGIFEQDVAVRMVMVDNTDIVFTDADLDEYDNDSGDLDANQATIDLHIGTLNYDIGHLFGTGGGGVAYPEVVCQEGWKAQGLTGSDGPIGDAFDVDYVAHEIGHQFGADHTFNVATGACGGHRVASSAFEPDSGSTIMAYAGICGAANLQAHSDPYFHVRSFDQIVAFTTTLGDGCAVQTSTANNAPSVTAGAAITIPRSTPFYLNGSATDPDLDPLTYCWEQFNAGSPLFRSFNPVSSGFRTFPKLSSLLSNTSPIGEVLSTTSRTMTFRLTARDNRPGGGGVNYASTTVAVTAAAGPFLVTAPNTAITWNGNSAQTVTWNVANTTSAPVSCASVNISLSTDGGNTFPTTLATTTPNDGSQSITVPNLTTTSARVRVECATSPFFDLSNADFTIEQSINVIATATAPNNVDVTWDAVPGAVSYEVYRRSAPGSYAFAGSSATPNFSDTTVSAGNAYLYAVKSLDGVTTSALSAPDLATTFSFTDPVPTIIRSLHITELRTAVASLRALAGLSAFSFTDPTLTTGVTKVKAAHVTDLRTAQNAALTAFGFSARTYTDTLLVNTTAVKAVHVTEVRAGVE